MKIYAFIFAREGSKGLPGKNTKNLFGTPLIAWSILKAKEVKEIEKVIVSTDSESIAEIAVKYGAEVPFIRPKELADDSSPEWLSWQHALQYLKINNDLPDVFVSVPATSPLRKASDIKMCIEKFKLNNSDLIITVSEPHRNPYFNMVQDQGDGFVKIILDSEGPFYRRQDAPKVYDMATVAYVTSPKYILNNTGLFSGKVESVIIPYERAIDIDTQFDFDIAELLLKKG